MAEQLLIPESLLKPLRSVPGFDEAAFLAAHQQVPVTSVRLHPLKGNAFRDEADDVVAWCSQGRYLPVRPVFTLDPAFHGGAYYVQEASSMFLDYLIRQLVPERNNLRVLDLCAAPGGKSTLLASLLEKDSLLVSNEVIRSRASILEENMARWGYMNAWVTSDDPAVLGKLSGYFDIIVVDAPCSGSGLFRKDPAALDEWSEANVELCCQRQKRIIADVWPSLKKGGIMVYATCSYSPEENEQILKWLAVTFSAENAGVDVPREWGITTVTLQEGQPAGYRFSPDKARGEGFFIAAVRKTTDTAVAKPAKFRHKEAHQAQERISNLLTGDAFTCIPTDGDAFSAMHTAHVPDYYLLKNSLYFRRAGLPAGHFAGNDWLPSHDLALSVDLAEHVPAIPVDRDTALRFLRKEDPGLSPLAKGWYRIVYEGIGLGWVKSLGNRYNNYLPKYWRIRMQAP